MEEAKNSEFQVYDNRYRTVGDKLYFPKFVCVKFALTISESLTARSL